MFFQERRSEFLPGFRIPEGGDILECTQKISPITYCADPMHGGLHCGGGGGGVG